MKNIKRIGYRIPTNVGDYVTLDSFSTISDTDIAVISTNLNNTDYFAFEDFAIRTYRGKDLYSKELSYLIQEHCEHWNKEIDFFLKRGGTLFVILTEKDDFYIYANKSKSENEVMLFSNYKFIPDYGISYATLCGTKMIPKNSLVNNLHEKFADLLSFSVSISGNLLTPIFSTEKDSRILGGIFQIYSGHIIFIPEVKFNIPDFLETNEDDGKEYYTGRAIKKADILINCLIEIHNVINKNQEMTPRPLWIDNFELENVKTTKQKINVLTEKINKESKKLEHLNTMLEEQEEIKQLLYETGKPLENAVIHALKIMGYKAENYRDKDDEFDQVIVSPEGDRFIGECEGKDNKDIDISKIRQLLDNLNADFAKENVQEKANGLLFGNPQRFKSPNERNLDFTNKCKTSATREKIGLILTSDLFSVCKVIIETKDQEYAKKCRCAILEQLGNVIKFPEYHSSFETDKTMESLI